MQTFFVSIDSFLLIIDFPKESNHCVGMKNKVETKTKNVIFEGVNDTKIITKYEFVVWS